jgi:hypothetical protein
MILLFYLLCSLVLLYWSYSPVWVLASFLRIRNSTFFGLGVVIPRPRLYWSVPFDLSSMSGSTASFTLPLA